MKTKASKSTAPSARALRNQIDRQAHGPVVLSRNDSRRLLRNDPLLKHRVAFIS